MPQVVQAGDLKEFLELAFTQSSEASKIDSFGAKLLVAGGNKSLRNFLQEYVDVVNNLPNVKNI